MATPRVFISSTCYDLSEVRDSLKEFIQGLYLEPVLSDYGDVFYHPDLHTHESCLQEVQNCQLFVLIIGGRRGGEYVADPDKSIVNAEYAAAKQCRIPVFTFVKRDVLSEHRFYQRNKGKDIEFSSIVKKEDGPRIFAFIDEVRRAPTNNAFFPFDTGADIKELLGKQLAGLLYDLLRNREHREQILTINRLLSNIKLANEKAEELIKNVYKAVDQQNAPEVISDLDKLDRANQFFQTVGNEFMVGFHANPDEVLQHKEEDWPSFLVEAMSFRCHEGVQVASGRITVFLEAPHGLTDLPISVGGEAPPTARELQKLYDAYRSLDEDQKRKILKKHLIVD